MTLVVFSPLALSCLLLLDAAFGSLTSSGSPNRSRGGWLFDGNGGLDGFDFLLTPRLPHHLKELECRDGQRGLAAVAKDKQRIQPDLDAAGTRQIAEPVVFAGEQVGFVIDEVEFALNALEAGGSGQVLAKDGSDLI